uniref:Ribosomal_L28e domain-containing protein n=1 Tax=Strongyloides venezuelensis TaxID=75913 RepID=A0A0K0FZ99_STRVS
MCILHRRGSLSGYVLPSLDVFILWEFTSSSIKFDTLLSRSTRLKVLVVDSCQPMAKMWQAVCGTSSIQALVCKQRESCSCIRLVTARGYENQVFLVPEKQNLNYFRKKHYRAQKDLFQRAKKTCAYKTPEIFPYLCGVLAPAMLVEKTAKKKERTFKLIKMLGA